MAVGKLTGQPGNTVPLEGESEIRQTSSAVDLVTLTLASGATSTAAGKGLVVKRWGDYGSSAGVAMFEVDYDGVYGRRKVTALTTASTAVDIASSQSGMFMLIPASASGWTITLPACAAGLWYEFYVTGAQSTAAAVKIKGASTGLMVFYADAAGDMITLGKASGAPTIGGSLRVISDGALWYCITQPAFSSAAPTSLTMTEYSFGT